MHSQLPIAEVWLGRLFAAVVMGLMVLNGVVLVVSPKAWFKLPTWLGFQGSFTENGFRGWFGALRLRMCGVLMLSFISYIVYSLLLDMRSRP